MPEICMLETPTTALLRRSSPGYGPAYQTQGIAIDSRRAALQHDAYAAALRDCGLTVAFVESDPRFYDCVFIEDTAVVWGSAVLMTSMGGQHRVGEEEAVRDFLRASHRVTDLPPGATLEGGDVMHCDHTTFVGISGRTNAQGAEALRSFLGQFGRPVVCVDVDRILHLKTGATYLGNDTLIAATEQMDLRGVAGFKILATAPGEAACANCLRIGRHLILPAGYPKTAALLRTFTMDHGLETHVLDISEFEKGGGSLSCLSLMWRP